MKKNRIITIVLFLLLTIFGGLHTDQIPDFINEVSTTHGSQSVTQEHWYESLPPYSGTPYVEVNRNIPFFTEAEKKTKESFEKYSDLDSLGRVQPAFACLSEDMLPTEKRGDISQIRPSGWHNKQYTIDGRTFWWANRSHMIAYSVGGDDTEKQIFTGTDYCNHDGMIPFERTVREYIYDHPSKHILYRVTPAFEGDELVPRGVLLEAWSVEDGGFESFCVYCYNVQPGIEIDYQTGNTKEIK